MNFTVKEYRQVVEYIAKEVSKGNLRPGNYVSEYIHSLPHNYLHELRKIFEEVDEELRKTKGPFSSTGHLFTNIPIFREAPFLLEFFILLERNEMLATPEVHAEVTNKFQAFVILLRAIDLENQDKFEEAEKIRKSMFKDVISSVLTESIGSGRFQAKVFKNKEELTEFLQQEILEKKCSKCYKDHCPTKDDLENGKLPQWMVSKMILNGMPLDSNICN